MDVAREQVQATNEEIEQAFDALGFGVTVDPEYGSDVCYGPAAEMDGFRRDRSGWSDPGEIVVDTDGAFHVRGAQAGKGKPRRDVVLIRFGEHCAIWGMDDD